MSDRRLIDDIKSRIDIADVIARYTRLRKTGKSYSGLCPFHEEKTPSFHVYTDTQTYYCFACHEAGDLFSFVMKKNGLTFPEAVEMLSSQAGLNPKDYGYSHAERARSLYDVMSMADEYYRECFRKLPGGRAYMERRGFSANDAESFGLGYAPDSWDGLTRALHAKGVTDKELIDAGLVIQNERGIYDRFRGRVIFPVKNQAGKITAFGGRAVTQETSAKYINSPETEIYRKRNSLYLLNIASGKIRETGYSILCEGYMDALRLHKSGFGQAVASLGTSLTAEQAGLLKRFADRCYICYDTDSAGKTAAVRGMYILAENGLDVRIVVLPEGKDPDEFLSNSKNPSEDFGKALSSSLSLLEYHIEILKPKLNNELTKKKALQELWEGVKRLDPYEALRYTGNLCGVFVIPHDEMRKMILSSSDNPEPPEVNKPAEPVLINDEAECAFCALLMKYRECRLRVKAEEIGGLLTNGETQMAASAILSEDPENIMDIWRTVGDTVKTGIIARGNIALSKKTAKTWREQWESVYSELETLRIKRRMSEIVVKLNEHTADFDEGREFMELQQKLQGLKI